MLRKQQRIEDLFDFASHGYEVGDQIGEGGYGKVFLCKKLDSTEVRAMKIIQLTANEAEMKAIKNDADVL